MLLNWWRLLSSFAAFVRQTHTFSLHFSSYVETIVSIIIKIVKNSLIFIFYKNIKIFKAIFYPKDLLLIPARIEAQKKCVTSNILIVFRILHHIPIGLTHVLDEKFTCALYFYNKTHLAARYTKIDFLFLFRKLCISGTTRYSIFPFI